MTTKRSKTEMTHELQTAARNGRWKRVRALVKYPDSRFTEAGKKTARNLRGALRHT